MRMMSAPQWSPQSGKVGCGAKATDPSGGGGGESCAINRVWTGVWNWPWGYRTGRSSCLDLRHKTAGTRAPLRPCLMMLLSEAPRRAGEETAALSLPEPMDPMDQWPVVRGGIGRGGWVMERATRSAFASVGLSKVYTRMVGSLGCFLEILMRGGHLYFLRYLSEVLLTFR